MANLPAIAPDSLDFVLLSFEGPDEYAMAGGLGVRMKELALELASQGFRTHLVFIGDPGLPALEQPEPKLNLHRWGQWLSAYHPAGVYDGEEAKLVDWNERLPEFVVSTLIAPAAAEGRFTAVLSEEWHTAHSICQISDLLWTRGLRDKVLLLWNANNIMGFDRINWGRLAYCTQVTTVSRYMKHIMWGCGVNPLVIPNGIPADRICDADPQLVSRLRGVFPGHELVFKIGRFSPDKRWLMAVDALAVEKQHGNPVTALIRGGLEPHGREVLDHARASGLTVTDVKLPHNPTEAIAALEQAAPADIYHITSFMHEELISLIYCASDAVLANSGHEPFGLVGLEVMAAGGIAFLGATGEDYAVSFLNSVVLDTDDPLEISVSLDFLRAHPDVRAKLKKDARLTAHSFTWESVVRENLLNRLEYVALCQLVLSPPHESISTSHAPGEILGPRGNQTTEAILPSTEGASLAYGGGYVSERLPVKPRGSQTGKGRPKPKKPADAPASKTSTKPPSKPKARPTTRTSGRKKS